MADDQSKTTEDDADMAYTLARATEAIQLAREPSCSQGSPKSVTLKVLVDQAGACSSVVSILIEDGGEA